MEGVGAVGLVAAVGGMVEGGVEDMAEGPGEATGVAVVGGTGVAARMEQHHPGRLCLQASVPPHPCTAWTQGEPERQQLHLSSHAAVLLLWCPCPVVAEDPTSERMHGNTAGSCGGSRLTVSLCRYGSSRDRDRGRDSYRSRDDGYSRRRSRTRSRSPRRYR